MAASMRPDFCCLLLATFLSSARLVGGQNQQFARQQAVGNQQFAGQQAVGNQQFQQAGGQQALGNQAGGVRQQAAGQQAARVLLPRQPVQGQGQGQQLAGQQAAQGQYYGRAAEVPAVQGSNLGQRQEPAAQRSNLKYQNGNAVDVNQDRKLNAKPADNAQNNVAGFQQQLDSLKDRQQQKDNAANAQAGANAVPNYQADAKLAAKRNNRTRSELKQYKVQDTAGNIADNKGVGAGVQNVGGGAEARAKIPDIHGAVRDSVGNINNDKVQYHDRDFQALKQDNGIAKVQDKAGASDFDVAHKTRDDNQPGNRDSNAGVGESNVDTDKGGVDKGNKGDVPVHIKFIDGEVEKNVKESNNGDDDFGDEDEAEDADDDDKDDDDEDYYGNDARSDTKVVDNNAIKAPQDNEIPKNIGDDNGNVQGDRQHVVHEKEKDKEGSLKVVWDWSDFAVNFEQYVMPEQKIRRAPHATTGEPWPMPQYYVSKKDKVYGLNKANFRFKYTKVRCDIIEKAVERYRLFIFEDAVEDMYDNFQHAQSTMFEDPSTKYELPLYLEAPYVTMLSIKIRKPCAKYPVAKSDESYDLFVKRTGAHLWANEVWGALRGLETFSQLVFKGTNQQLYIRDTVINDYPRFTHRGVMIDSSRHFIFKETIYDVLEGMAHNKMNVMHWHLVDDQSFPFYSQVYPDLSAKGAFHPTFVYMPEDIQDIIEFARVRGIRVEPEFDTPGHTYSWGLSRPDLMTQCYQGDRPVDGYLGPMDPSKNETFRFLSNFFKDVLHVFKDQYIHLGGDEVPMTCWQSNPEVVKFLGKLTGSSDSNHPQTNDPYYYSYDVRKLLEYYVTRLIKDLKATAAKRTNGVRMVFWQEIMNNDVQLPNDTIIHVWQGGMEDVQRAISLGLNVIYSTCWYLDLIEYGTKWSKYYQCDPADSSYGFTLDESKVLGGEACLWAEYIDNENLMTTLWPRASAAAERLWSNKDLRDLDSAAARLQEHRCRMLSRGLGVGQISGPDYCLRRGKRRHLVNETQANCTQSQCAQYNEKGRVEVEKIKVEFEQKGGRISDCSQAVLQAGSQLTLMLLLFITIAVVITLKFSKQKIIQVRMCRNKTILMVFITLILIYFMCYTSVWMQAMQFKGSFEKSVSSNVS